MQGRERSGWKSAGQRVSRLCVSLIQDGRVEH